MNNERYNQIVDEAHEKWIDENWNKRIYPNINGKEEFINKIKTNIEFSEKWGLKIEERMLSTEERNQWYHINWNANNPLMKSDWKFYELDQQNVPTKLIAITYNNQIIEIYE